MSKEKVDEWFLLAALVVGGAVMSHYIQKGGDDWKVFAAIGFLTLGIARGRQWFGSVVAAIKAYKERKNGSTG